jgi:hypothetical protein
MTKIQGKASRIKKLRDSLIFREYPFLADSLVLIVRDGKYVLFERVYLTYWIFEIDKSYKLLFNLNQGRIIELDDLEEYIPTK